MTDTTYITPAGIECRMLNTDVVKMPNTNLVEMKLEGVRDSATISLTLRGGFSVRPEFEGSGTFDSMADAMVFAEQGLLKVRAEAKAKAAEAEAARQKRVTEAEANFAEGIAALGAVPAPDPYGELL